MKERDKEKHYKWEKKLDKVLKASGWIFCEFGEWTFNYEYPFEEVRQSIVELIAELLEEQEV